MTGLSDRVTPATPGVAAERARDSAAAVRDIAKRWPGPTVERGRPSGSVAGAELACPAPEPGRLLELRPIPSQLQRPLLRAVSRTRKGNCPDWERRRRTSGRPRWPCSPTSPPDRPPRRRGPMKTILDGIRFIVRSQNPKTGGLYGKNSSPMYVHGMAAIVLCEAYGMTKDNSLRIPAQRAIQFIEASQHPQQEGLAVLRRRADADRGDTSVVGWQAHGPQERAWMAGLEVNPKTMELAKIYMNLAKKGKSGGLFSYEPTPASGPSPSMTAVGLLCQQFLGAKRDDPAMKEG